MRKNKVFVIGLNRCGTRAMTDMLNELGYNIVHYDLWRKMIAWAKDGVLKPLPELAGIDGTADLPTPTLFRQLDVVYPESKFVFTTRNFGKWIDSQINHCLRHLEDRPLRSHLFTYGCEQFNFQHYRDVWNRHHEDVSDYFQGRETDLFVVHLENELKGNEEAIRERMRVWLNGKGERP